ncbi:MAG: DUF1553 domain-containing protein [Planctomycetes bacterium]|nr:DUF1553 domain-containing protein [Planctomycetota bacterium]
MSSRILSTLIALAVGASAARAQDRLEYNRDIRPILAENCFACHGPDSASRKADLRLDRRDDAVKAGAIVPGKADKSALVERIFSSEKRHMMPPPRSLKKLTTAQKDALRRWVASGAEYQPHWSFIAPTRPAVPAVKKSGWTRNPVDNFILARLEAAGLQPGVEADRRTLARRLSLDLIGLPPTPEDVEAFVNDKAVDAYERYVDQLMASRHWGEHRGRYWLDAARFADTHGIHFDNFREIWAYRDWVISAFNRNLSFDRFTIEQLAGDLLPKRTLDQQVATGFNRCNITTNEGGAISEEYLVLYTRDRTETTSFVWLGLTSNCAVCHDHKFDPLSQREFYELSAFFNNTTQNAMDGNIKDTPPTVFVPRMEDAPRWEGLAQRIVDVRKQLDARKQLARAEFDKWSIKTSPAGVVSPGTQQGLRFHAPLNDNTDKVAIAVDGKSRALALAAKGAWAPGHVGAYAFRSLPGAALEISDAGDFEREQPFSAGAWVYLPGNVTAGAILARMDDASDFRGWDLWVENNRVGTHIIHKWPDNAIKVVSQNALKPKQWSHVFVSYDGSGKASGVRIFINGVPQDVRTTFADSLNASIRTKVPLKLAQRHNSSRINNALIQDVRLYARAVPGDEVTQLMRSVRAAHLLATAGSKRSAAEKEELFDWWLPSQDTAFRDLQRQLDGLQREESAIKSRGTIAHVMQEKAQEPVAYILHRGDYDKRRDQVKPATPAFLPAFPADLPRNRLGFARWLLRPENPLSARVTVNRFWQEVFGTGLVRTTGDFGVTGELPSHPELLDWLAVEFRETGWDVKRFFKMLVTSASYRQSAAVTREKLDKDAFNRLLSRGPRYRLDAEMIRDYALAASGLLVPKIGGPSVKPYQPEGVWEAVAMIGSNTRDYRADTGENLYRRSMYTFWKRAAPPASMDILNAPNRETCATRRERTNTPLQALVTLNDPQFVEAARHLAQLTLKSSDKLDSRLDFMARRLLCRPLHADESRVLREVHGELLAHYRANPENARKLITVGESRPAPGMDPASLAAWTMVANQLLNLDEVLNK